MCERGRENGIKETFYRDYTALLFSPSVSGADKWTWQRNAATERWGTWHLTAVEVIQNHFLIKFLMSPSVQLHLLIFQSRPPHPTNAHILKPSRGKCLQWQVGSMGAWGEKSWEQKWKHTTATNFWACWRTQEDLENGWEKKKEWEICDILIREKKEGAGDLETPAFWSQRPFFFILFHSQLFRLFFFPFWSSFLCFYVFTLGFVLNVLALSVKVIIIVIFCRWD